MGDDPKRSALNKLNQMHDVKNVFVVDGSAFTTASDAHSHAQLGDAYDGLAEKMKVLGVREVCVFERHKRRAVSLD